MPPLSAHTSMSEFIPDVPAALQWQGETDGHLDILDQTLLPGRTEQVRCHDVLAVVEAIKMLRVRGAPAIGIAGAYGLVIAVNEASRQGLSAAAALAHLRQRADELATARPTAVNLQWAVDRLLKLVDAAGETPAIDLLATSLLAEARRIHDEDRNLCAAIGRFGADLVPEGDILTHCNTGSLATGGDGTALGVIVTAWRQGRRFRVFADETRPLLQGARLTAWELVQRQIPVTVLVDGAAAHLLKTGRVGCCIVGADRITANGDTANKIGTYGLAVAARAHGVPFFVAAPSSSFDLSLATGEAIPIEERAAAEVLEPLGVRAAPVGAEAFNPAFDVTPAELITAIITEQGIIRDIGPTTVAAVLGN